MEIKENPTSLSLDRESIPEDTDMFWLNRAAIVNIHKEKKG